jgi:protein-S-isoprenylcysteine O-methyltransferase Ste14
VNVTPESDLFLIGLGLAVWARVHLGRNWGAPMSEKVDAELVTTGPYRYIRNPIYSGIVLAAIGTAVAVSFYWFVAAALMATYFVYSATVEEHTMERLFPDAYPAYKRSTKKLIPFIF